MGKREPFSTFGWSVQGTARRTATIHHWRFLALQSQGQNVGRLHSLGRFGECLKGCPRAASYGSGVQGDMLRGLAVPRRAEAPHWFGVDCKW
jgi:hypothetical protein